MSATITITIENVDFEATLNDSPVAIALAERLPHQVRMSRWGDEYYGSVGLGMENDADAREEVEIGTVAYWPTGDSLCIFFGPTPVSRGDEPRAASAVTVIGRITSNNTDDLRRFGDTVTANIERVQR